MVPLCLPRAFPSYWLFVLAVFCFTRFPFRYLVVGKASRIGRLSPHDLGGSFSLAGPSYFPAWASRWQGNTATTQSIPLPTTPCWRDLFRTLQHPCILFAIPVKSATRYLSSRGCLFAVIGPLSRRPMCPILFHLFGCNASA